jgi:peroxiredoxin-like protein
MIDYRARGKPMETKKSWKSFRYPTHSVWLQGRRLKTSLPGKPDLEISSPPEFKGEDGVWTPEDLFVTALNSCIMQTFLSFTDQKKLALAAYESSAEALLEFKDGKYRFTEITVRPQVTLNSQEDAERARQIMESAHANCFISNSINCSVKVLPEFKFA